MGCGSSSTNDGDGGVNPPGGDGGVTGDGGGDGLVDGGIPGMEPPDDLSTATGCDGIFNPDQRLTFEISMSSGDWSALKSDLTNSVYYPAQLSCGGEASVNVGIRRKRSGGTDKPGLKIDVDWGVANQYWHGLRKLSLENGISEGTGTAGVRDVLAEYLAWRIMDLADAMASRAVFVDVVVNGDAIGTYTNVEQVDKRFLRSRLVDDEGWLYKRSGSNDDGYKTNETMANPFEDDFCFLDRQAPCAIPTDAAWLSEHVDIEQLIRFGGVNALIANSDSPLSKDNNYYFYDYGLGRRVYFPWDLDTAMRDDAQSFFRAEVSGGVTFYWDLLFSHWEADYDARWTALLAGPISVEAIHAELDRAVDVGAGGLDGDPSLDGDAASAADELKAWWTARHAAVTSELSGH